LRLRGKQWGGKTRGDRDGKEGKGGGLFVLLAKIPAGTHGCSHVCAVLMFSLQYPAPVM